MELHRQPLALLADWLRLYSALTVRHAITDLRAFTPEYFGGLLAIDDVLMVCARSAGEVVGAQIYVLQGDVAYFHLSACSPQGYAEDASAAMCWSAMEMLRESAAWIDWGGSAGAIAKERDGLAWFKAGWSNQTRDAWLLGAVLDRERYADLARDHAQTSYFPAYRAGEFT